MKTLSGNIVKRPSCVSVDRDKFEYLIRNSVTGQMWSLPTYYLEPEDLRVLADELEKEREKS